MLNLSNLKYVIWENLTKCGEKLANLCQKNYYMCTFCAAQQVWDPYECADVVRYLTEKFARFAGAATSRTPVTEAGLLVLSIGNTGYDCRCVDLSAIFFRIILVTPD